MFETKLDGNELSKLADTISAKRAVDRYGELETEFPASHTEKIYLANALSRIGMGDTIENCLNLPLPSEERQLKDDQLKKLLEELAKAYLNAPK